MFDYIIIILARDVDERFKKLKARRADGGNAGNVGEHGEGTDTERFHYPAEGQRNTNTARATERIAELMDAMMNRVF